MIVIITFATAMTCPIPSTLARRVQAGVPARCNCDGLQHPRKSLFLRVTGIPEPAWRPYTNKGTGALAPFVREDGYGYLVTNKIVGLNRRSSVRGAEPCNRRPAGEAALARTAIGAGSIMPEAARSNESDRAEPRSRRRGEGEAEALSGPRDGRVIAFATSHRWQLRWQVGIASAQKPGNALLSCQRGTGLLVRTLAWLGAFGCAADRSPARVAAGQDGCRLERHGRAPLLCGLTRRRSSQSETRDFVGKICGKVACRLRRLAAGRGLRRTVRPPIGRRRAPAGPGALAASPSSARPPREKSKGVAPLRGAALPASPWLRAFARGWEFFRPTPTRKSKNRPQRGPGEGICSRECAQRNRVS